MKKENLMKKYRTGDIGPEDLQLLEKYISEGIISLEEIEDLHKIQEATANVEIPEPGDDIRSNFYHMLANEKRKVSVSGLLDKVRSWMTVLWANPGYSLAYTFGIMMIGVAAGLLVSPAGRYQNELTSLNSEMHQMKQLIMLSMLNEQSATKRLKAVNMSTEFERTTTTVVNALLNTLNNDSNVNVRLAALEALVVYAHIPEVREGLILSINQQESPIVQVSLAEIMVRLQEKGSVEELEKLLERENIDSEIKEHLRVSIDQII